MKSVTTRTPSGCRKCKIPGKTLPCPHMMFREEENSKVTRSQWDLTFSQVVWLLSLLDCSRVYKSLQWWPTARDSG
eukprot:1151098-Pelagomonas_calceolata.AAC.8